MTFKLLVLATVIALGGCAKDESSGGDKASTNAEATAGDSEPKKKATEGRKKRVKKDRGEGSMMLGEIEWLSTSARAKLKDDKLKISMSRMDGRVGEKMVRHSLTLHVPDFKGPGDYTIPSFGGIPSLYVVVGFDVSDTKSEDEGQAAAMKALSESKTVMLAGAKVTITSVTATEVIGTFEHKTAKVSMTDGKFRAIIKPNK